MNFVIFFMNSKFSKYFSNGRISFDFNSKINCYELFLNFKNVFKMNLKENYYKALELYHRLSLINSNFY